MSWSRRQSTRSSAGPFLSNAPLLLAVVTANVFDLAIFRAASRVKSSSLRVSFTPLRRPGTLRICLNQVQGGADAHNPMVGRLMGTW